MEAVLEAERALPVEARVLSRFPTRWSTHIPTLAVLAAVAWWLLVATRWGGGRDAGAVTGGGILTALALLAVRPDRFLGRAALLTACAVSGGALVVAATAPTGWAGAPNAAAYVCAAWTVICLAAAVIRDPLVVRPLLGLLVIGVMLEMEEAWLAWWGGEDPTVPITGTFYWWNPFAAYLIPGAVIGYAAFLATSRHSAALGLVGFTLGTIGLAYSTSRAAGVCFVVAVAVISATHLRRGWQGAKRVALGLATAGVAAWVVGGPPFFPHHAAGLGGSPLAGTAARAAGESLSQNGGYRLQFWGDALEVFGRHPIVGGGYHSLATDSAAHVSQGTALSPLAHSGYFQALADGGLVLAVPFLFGCAAIALYVLSDLRLAVRNRDFSIRGFAVPLVLGAMLAHSAVDFDWTYPADFVLVAVLAGLVAGSRWRVKRPVVRARSVTVCAVLVGVVTLGVASTAAWSGDTRLNLPIDGHAASGGAR